MSKIYIIGPVASGKTTLAKRLSKDLNIKHYELDSVIFETKESGDIKRSKEEVNNIFTKIINSNNWIIEDVGRDIFKAAYEKADIIIFINISRLLIYKRIIFRWIKQKIGTEKNTYKPNLNILIKMFRWANNDIKGNKLKSFNIYKDKLLIVDNKKIKDYQNNILNYINKK